MPEFDIRSSILLAHNKLFIMFHLLRISFRVYKTPVKLLLSYLQCIPCVRPIVSVGPSLLELPFLSLSICQFSDSFPLHTFVSFLHRGVYTFVRVRDNIWAIPIAFVYYIFRSTIALVIFNS